VHRAGHGHRRRDGAVARIDFTGVDASTIVRRRDRGELLRSLSGVLVLMGISDGTAKRSSRCSRAIGSRS